MASRDTTPAYTGDGLQAEFDEHALDGDPNLIELYDDEDLESEEVEEELPQPSQRPRWFQRLIDIRGRHAGEAKRKTAAAAVSTASVFQGYSKSLWSQVIGSATEWVDSRQNPQRSRLSRLGSLISFYFSPVMLRIGFRLIVAIGCANLAVYGVVNWSDNEALRFPSRNPQDVKSMFPILGECTSFEYSMYLFDFMLVVGVLAFFTAYWIESYADD
jgi:hypothetical protein